MSDLQTAKDRPRTNTRLRGVASGMEQPKAIEGVKTIGRYEILKVLGKGAMGVVYKGRDPLLDRVVAVKTIVAPERVGKRGRSAYLERFQREAKAAAKMQHPAIVTIFDVGLEGNQPFMVLEYLPGESLADRLDRVRLPLGKAVAIARDLASALAFAHKERIVHRDVKPANVLHAGEDRWKLADFGIARMPNSDLTQAGIFMGTPGYAPPEAIREGMYTAQADVFAWGAVLYELLSGRIPYEGPDTPTTNGYVLRATARNPRVYDPSIPEPLADVVMTALESDPSTRFQTAEEAEKALTKAWDKCLNDALVHPSALTAQEKPHASVRGPMHGPPSGPPPKPPAPPAEREPSAGETAPMIVRGKEATVGDDDPTRIMIREESDIESEKTATSARSASDPSVVIDEMEPELSEDERIMAMAKKTAKGGRSSDTATLTPSQQDAPTMWTWVVLVLVAVVGGAVAAFYIWRL